MHQKSTLPKAEVAVFPIRTRIADQGDEREPVAPIEPQVAPLTEGAEGVETYQADRALHAMLARLSSGISPAALLLAYTDWLSHLASSPQRRIEIAQEALIDTKRFFEASQRFFSPGQGPWSLIKPQPQDKRFGRPEWEHPPFNLMAQVFLLGEQWWHNATTGVRGVAKQNEAIVEFSIRQMLDVMSPSNFAATNPEVLRRTFESGGNNFACGWRNRSRVVTMRDHAIRHRRSRRPCGPGHSATRISSRSTTKLVSRVSSRASSELRIARKPFV